MEPGRQKYAVYRDNELIATGISSLAATNILVRKDAKMEFAQGRPAKYLITGSAGFNCTGAHCKGRVVWEGTRKIRSFVQPAIPFSVHGQAESFRSW